MEKSDKLPIVSVIGRSGAGKTTFLTRLIAEFKSRGYRVAVIKHSQPRDADHGSVEFDRPGKDTWRHFEAGADTVVLATSDRFAMVHRLSHELPPDELAQLLPDPVDVVITEGFKQAGLPAIEVMRTTDIQEPVGDPAHRIALVTDVHPPRSSGKYQHLEPPRFSITDAVGVADFLIGRLNLSPLQTGIRSPKGR